MTAERKQSEVERGRERLRPLLLLAIILFLGAVVRFSPVIVSDFPLNDGGLFLQMVEDIRAAGYALPVYTTYNNDSLPFAYPPLGFYLAAALADLLAAPALQVIRLLPAGFSVLCLVAFYRLSAEFALSQAERLPALLAFTLIPRNFLWNIMGGGLTRALGFLFLLLTLTAVLRMYRRPTPGRVLAAIVPAGLTVLSHPEQAWCGVISALVLLAAFRPTRARLLAVIATGAGTAALTAPWWGTILARHGLSPYLAAASTAGAWQIGLLRFATFSLSEELFAGVLPALAFIGLFAALGKREWLLPLWTLLLFVLSARTALTMATMPMALLAASAIAQVVQPNLVPPSIAPEGSSLMGPARRWLAPAFVVALTLNGFVTAFAAPLAEWSPLSVLSAEERAAMTWVRDNVPAEAEFVVVSGWSRWAADGVAEWFPALSGRTSTTTVQGYEWLPGEYERRRADYGGLQACGAQGVACLEEWTAKHGADAAYLFVARPPASPLTGNGRLPTEILIASATDSPDYVSLYSGAGGAVFSRVAPRP